MKLSWPGIHTGQNKRLRRSMSAFRRQKLLFAYLSTLPILAYLFLFGVLPIFYVLYLSVFDWGLLTARKPFAGFDNYLRAFGDDIFWISLRNTAYFTAARTFIGLPVSLMLALAFYDMKSRWRSSFVTIYFLPSVTSVVAISIVFQFLYHPQSGLFNQILTGLGLPKLLFLRSAQQALASVTGMLIWRGVGFQAIIYLAALDAIPRVLFEAAELDGATWWQRFRNITLPLLKQANIFIFIVTILWAFQMFEPIYVMTEPVGGPLDSTQVLVLYIVQNAFDYFRMGYASAMAMILMVIILVLTLVQLRLGRQDWEY